jgi:hypothetical protein
MVANDGAHDPLFGRNEFGDRVERVRVSTALPNARSLSFTVAGDHVLADDTAREDLGQDAWQGVAAVLWADPAGRRLGVYAVYRHQLEADRERTTDAGVVDLYGELPVAVGAQGHRLQFGLEAAGIEGRTSRSQSYNSTEGLRVESAGVLAQAGAWTPKDRVGLILRGGWASGDGDPDDGVSHDFAFDRDADVGRARSTRRPTPSSPTRPTWATRRTASRTWPRKGRSAGRRSGRRPWSTPRVPA